MRCWRCGAENNDHTQTCEACGSNLQRKDCVTAEGGYLRQVYDAFSPDEVFRDVDVLPNGLADVWPEGKLMKNQLRTIMSSGVGNAYLNQLNHAGKPDEAFEEKIRNLIVSGAGMSEETAGNWMGYFDEMIGWPTINEHNAPSAGGREAVNDNADQTNGQETGTKGQSASPKKKKIWLIAYCIVFTLLISILFLEAIFVIVQPALFYASYMLYSNYCIRSDDPKEQRKRMLQISGGLALIVLLVLLPSGLMSPLIGGLLEWPVQYGFIRLLHSWYKAKNSADES